MEPLKTTNSESISNDLTLPPRMREFSNPAPGQAEALRAMVRQALNTNIPVLDSIELQDHGNARTNFHVHMKSVLESRFSVAFDQTTGPVQLDDARTPVIHMATPADLAVLQDASEVLGRTLVSREDESGQCLALKICRQGEPLDALTTEFKVMRTLAASQSALGLRGAYPVPLGLVEFESVVINDLMGKKGLAIPVPINIEKGRCQALMYRVDRKYFRYLNDSRVDPASFASAFRINVHDRKTFLSRGIVDTEIIELFHNREKNVGDSYRWVKPRFYDWMIDVHRILEKREGAGMLENVPKSTRYPNIRLSGPADFAATRHISDMLRDARLNQLADGRIARLLREAKGDHGQALKYLYAAFYGDMLLAHALMPPTYLQRQGKLNYELECESDETWLQLQMRELFDDYPGINYQLIAQQMAFFMTGRYTSMDIPEHLFPGARVQLVRHGRGGSYRPDAGWDFCRGESYVLPCGQTVHSYDLGPLNGPNPLQELVKALYLRTTDAVCERAGDGLESL